LALGSTSFPRGPGAPNKIVDAKAKPWHDDRVLCRLSPLNPANINKNRMAVCFSPWPLEIVNSTFI